MSNHCKKQRDSPTNRRSFVFPDAEKTHRVAMASHGIFLVCFSLFTDTRCCRAAVLSASIVSLTTRDQHGFIRLAYDKGQFAMSLRSMAANVQSET